MYTYINCFLKFGISILPPPPPRVLFALFFSSQKRFNELKASFLKSKTFKQQTTRLIKEKCP